MKRLLRIILITWCILSIIALIYVALKEMENMFILCCLNFILMSSFLFSNIEDLNTDLW